MITTPTVHMIMPYASFVYINSSIVAMSQTVASKQATM
jgi:hypothetical protein